MNRLGRVAWLLGAVVLVAVGGCESGSDQEKDTSRSFPGTTITVAAVGDPAALTAVRVWKTTWERDTGGTVKFAEAPVSPGDFGGADVILFPGDRMGELVVGRMVLGALLDSTVRPPIPMGNEAQPVDPLAFNDIVPPFRDQVSKYGSDRMGLPLGGSALVLVYRRDAFESDANKAAAREKGLTLAPPKTWAELDALIGFFHGRDWDGDGQPESGIAAALGADAEGVGDALFLNRAAALGQHPDHYALVFNPDTMEPRIASPPFVEAMTALAAWKGLTPPKGETFDAEAARAAFRAGDTAFLIDRAERASRWTDPKKPASVGVAALPGSPRVYDPDRKLWQEARSGLNRAPYLPRGGGWLVGMSASTSGRTRDAALDFLRTLAGPETSRGLLTEPAFPMLPIRNAQLGSGLPDPRSALGVDSRDWGAAVAQTITNPRAVPGLRIPGTAAYLAELTKARIAVLAGAPAESALADAARAWDAISKRLGVPTQLWHYRRSLNKLVTDPRPPGDDAK
ncbi:MAG: ABC-type sugar transport system, periplasmic component [Planctomycetota bacterium]|nr:ABC-type sugar transport system, periplasmic component [Planctomycetota bacterium]